MKVRKANRLNTTIHISLTILLFASLISCNPKATNPDTYVVMLSMDAYRWDYPERFSTPNLNAMANEGVKAEALIPCYPSKTFPNHYSMATGLHPNNHGIVCNKFYDQTLGYYAIGDRKSVENHEFYGGEPIWITAEKQGVKAATYYWVGSELPAEGKHATYWKPYKQKVPFEDRTDTVIHWLSLPVEQRPRLVMFYFHEPDWTSHEYGSLAPETKRVAERLDSLVGVFVQKIETLPIADKVNIMIVSDHGMADLSPEKYIRLADHINPDWIEIMTGGNPVFSIKPKEEFKEILLEKLKAIPHLKVWGRNEIPERYVYGSNPRIQEILIEAEFGYSVGLNIYPDSYKAATHGYDNQIPDMHGIFFAKGPAFKQNHVQPAFINTNLYSIVAHILGLTPAKTDGSIEEVKDIFK